MKVNVLGTEYTIIKNAIESEYPKLIDRNGYTDFSIKKIVLRKYEEDNDSVEDLTKVENKVLRHEIIHAFLYESGLHNASWAIEEEMVDWIALQFEKMLDVFRKIDALNNNYEKTNLTIDINGKELVNNIVDEMKKRTIDAVTSAK